MLGHTQSTRPMILVLRDREDLRNANIAMGTFLSLSLSLSLTRYRKKSPCELRRDAKRVKARQQELASKQDSEQQTSLSSNNDGLEASNTGRFVSPPSQYHAHPLDASHRSEELEDGEQNGSVDNSDHREDDMAAQAFL